MARQKNQTVETEIVKADQTENSVEVSKGSKLVNDNGEVNLSLIESGKVGYYKKISQSLDEHDLTSVITYGSDLQRAMDSYSNDFLNQQMTSNHGIESATLISNLLGEIQEVDLGDLEAPSAFKRFLMGIPLLKKLVVSVDQIKAKYNTIQKNIDEIVKKLEHTRLIAIRDNNLLQKQFENNCDYVSQLEDLIVAGKMKSEEIEQKIMEMEANFNGDDEYMISDMKEFKNHLDKRISDLILLRYAFKQSLTQIRIIQSTNIMDANNTESQITMTIPLWKNQLSLAVALYNQKQSLEIKNKVTNATNEILKKNAEMMKVQAIEANKQNQRSVIDIETLRDTTTKLIATVEGVKKVQEEGAAKRAAAEKELRALEKQMTVASIGVAETTKKIIAKELIDVESEE